MSRYVVVSGTWDPSKRELQLQPCFLTEYGDVPAALFEDDGATLLAVELRDDQQKLVWRAFIPTVAGCADPHGSEVQYVAAKLPFPDTTRWLRVFAHGELVHETKRWDAEPTVELKWTPTGALQGSDEVSWESAHRGNVPLHHFVVYSNDGGFTWQPLSLASAQQEVVVDFDRLPGGKGRIGIVTTDGLNTVWTWSDTFAVDVKSCIATIGSPHNGATVDAGLSVWLQGQGYWLEEGVPEHDLLVWSTKESVIGTGSLVEWRRPPAGTHEVTLTAGTKERAGTATIVVTIVGEQSPP